jgi:hypothetical protein
MTDRSFTLLELHLHDGIRLSVGGEEVLAPDAGGSGGSGEPRDGPDEGIGSESGNGRGRRRTAAGLLVLVAAALAVLWGLTEGNLDAARELDDA